MFGKFRVMIMGLECFARPEQKRLYEDKTSSETVSKPCRYAACGLTRKMVCSHKKLERRARIFSDIQFFARSH